MAWEIKQKKKNCHEPEWFGKFREIENFGGGSSMLFGHKAGWLLICFWTCWVCDEGFRWENIWQAIKGHLVSKSD